MMRLRRLAVELTVKLNRPCTTQNAKKLQYIYCQIGFQNLFKIVNPF